MFVRPLVKFVSGSPTLCPLDSSFVVIWYSTLKLKDNANWIVIDVVPFAVIEKLTGDSPAKSIQNYT